MYTRIYIYISYISYIYALINKFRISETRSFWFYNYVLLGCFCHRIFSLNTGLKLLPSESFIPCIDSLLGYSTGEFQAFQLVALWCLEPWINHLPPVCWPTFENLARNDSGFFTFGIMENIINIFRIIFVYMFTFTYISMFRNMIMPYFYLPYFFIWNFALFF